MAKKRKSRRRLPTNTAIRWYEEDRALQEWLQQFAGSHKMTSVIKLALYRLADLDAPEYLSNVDLDQKRVKVSAPDGVNLESLLEQIRETVRDEVRQVQESTERQSGGLAAQPNPTMMVSSRGIEMSGNGGLNTATDETTKSSGLDMSGPRRRAKTGPPATVPEMPAEPVWTEAMAAEAARKLVASINAFGKDKQ